MNEIEKAIQLLAQEKGIESEIIMEALKDALAAAFRKDFGSRQGNYKVAFDVTTGDIKVWDVKEVSEDYTEEQIEQDQEKLIELREKAREEERELTEEETASLIMYNPKTHLMLTQAKEVNKKAKVGEVLEIPQEVPGDFGRMAAQTAKQVIIQKIREAERKNVFEDFKEEEGNVIQGVVQRRDRTGNLIVDLGKITGIVPQGELVNGERYNAGARMQFYVSAVEMGARGPQITLSRSTNDMVSSVFHREIPEVDDGVVVIKAIARDPGSRSKVAVHTDDDSVDPIGACIGQRGSRITTIINELGGEKIDVIQWNENSIEFIKQALSPAKIEGVELDEESKEAKVLVPEDQFSLAIGRGGVNVRLASTLTGWKLNVVQAGGSVSEEDDGEADPESEEEEKQESGSEKSNTDKDEKALEAVEEDKEAKIVEEGEVAEEKDEKKSEEEKEETEEMIVEEKK